MHYKHVTAKFEMVAVLSVLYMVICTVTVMVLFIVQIVQYKITMIDLHVHNNYISLLAAK